MTQQNSRQCATKARFLRYYIEKVINMAASKFQIVRKCQVCSEEFMAKTIESWYCSPRCSKIAWKRRHDEEERNKLLDKVVKNIPKEQDYIKVTEAYALFGISRFTLYRLIRKGQISHINLGTNQIRVSKEELMKLYPLRPKTTDKPKQVKKLYSLEPKDCYTIGEISKKYKAICCKQRQGGHYQTAPVARQCGCGVFMVKNVNTSGKVSWRAFQGNQEQHDKD